MKLVMTTGTFDLLHKGHINRLKGAKERGDCLIVGLNTNEAISDRGKQTIYSYEERKAMLEAIKYVDQVVPIRKQEDKFYYINHFGIEEFIVGEEYKGFYDIPDIENLCKVVFLERTPNVSTTQIKEMLSEEYKTFVIDIDDTILVVEDRDFENAKPIQDVIDKINQLHSLGCKIILLTARGMKSQNNDPVKADLKYRAITEEWLKAHNVSYDELLFGKPNADAYVDDKAMGITDFVKLKLR